MNSRSRPPVRPGLAVFLDVDGTLLDLAPTPAAARPHPDTIQLLLDASRALDGAVALVSGRSIDQLDKMFFPLFLPVAGLHGLEHRNEKGQRVSHADPGKLDPVRERLRLFVEATPGLLLEDKQLGIAVHYRAAPQLESAVINEIVSASRQLGVARHIQLGDKVAELKAGIRNKGSAVCDFMQEPPFAGRCPVFVGDDLTDMDAFEWAIANGGFGVAVGERVQSSFALTDSREVGRWIEALIAASEPASAPSAGSGA